MISAVVVVMKTIPQLHLLKEDCNLEDFRKVVSEQSSLLGKMGIVTLKCEWNT